MFLQGAIAAGMLMIFLMGVIIIIPIIVIAFKSKSRNHKDKFLDQDYPSKQDFSIGRFLKFYILIVGAIIFLLFFLSRNFVFM